MKKFLLLLTFFLQFQAWAENIQGREIPNNGEFFQDENLWKSYYADNLKRLDRALNRKNIVFDSCPSKKLPDNSNDQTNIVNALSAYMGNFQFLKLNTNVFYSKSDRFQCRMDVTLLKQNFPEHLHNTPEDAIYWTNEMIAQRWKIASTSLKKCGIKIDNLTLTSFEFQGKYKSREPSYDLNKKAKDILLSPFWKNNEIEKTSSVKVVYIKNLASETDKISRGDRLYWDGAALNTELSTPGHMSTIWISKDTIYKPIAPEGLDQQDPGSLTETHEMYHTLTNEDNDTGHLHTRQDPDTYNPMSDLWMRGSGTFTEDQCKKMREIGQQRGLLRCSDQYAKLGANSNNP